MLTMTDIVTNLKRGNCDSLFTTGCLSTPWLFFLLPDLLKLSLGLATATHTIRLANCGGHAGKAHKKQLEKLAKMKSFTDKFKNKHRERFPQVEYVVCHCEKRHKPGCGCLSDAFIQKAQNKISFILSNSESAHKFAEALKTLPRHARDEHE